MPQDDVGSIIQLINLYAFAVDTQRWDLFDRIFMADVDADFSATAHWRDLASFKADFAAFHAPFDSTQHVMANHLVTVDGDRAHAFVHGSWRLIRRAAEGAPLWDGTGWYDDDLDPHRRRLADRPADLPGGVVDRQFRGQRDDRRGEVRDRHNRAARGGRAWRGRVSGGDRLNSPAANFPGRSR
jgi:hypothetical protein